jgi:hypothetical protein
MVALAFVPTQEGSKYYLLTLKILKLGYPCSIFHFPVFLIHEILRRAQILRKLS